MTRTLAAAAVLLAAPVPRGGWNLRDHIPFAEVVVQSHRGAGVLSPENSIEAFEIAWSLGTIPEADLRTTRDGIIVAFHDRDFERILPHAPPAERRRGIHDLTWEEVRRLDIGAWKGPRFAGQRVPSLEEMFAAMSSHPGRRLYIDIKNVDLEQLARQAHAAGMEGRLILASTDYAMIRQWKRLAPASHTLHWMGGTEERLAARLAALEEAAFEAVTQLQIHVRARPSPAGFEIAPSPRFLVETGGRLRRRGILFQVLPLENGDPALYRYLMDLGVASFATDYPDAVMQAIRNYYAQPRPR